MCYKTGQFYLLPTRCDGFVPMSTDGRVSEDAIAVHTVDYGQMTVPPSETAS